MRERGVRPSRLLQGAELGRRQGRVELRVDGNGTPHFEQQLVQCDPDVALARSGSGSASDRFERGLDINVPDPLVAGQRAGESPHIGKLRCDRL